MCEDCNCPLDATREKAWTVCKACADIRYAKWLTTPPAVEDMKVTPTGEHCPYIGQLPLYIKI